MLEIRRYRAADHDAVWSLHHRALEHAEAHAGHGPWDDDLHDIASVYLRAGGEFLVGLEAGVVVAMGGLVPRDSGSAEIRRMRVDPGCQRRGYGRRILAALEAAAADRGFARLTLDCTTQQTAACALYQAHGYRETHRSRLGALTLVHHAKALEGPRPA